MITNCQKAILWLFVAAYPDSTFSGKLINEDMFKNALETNNIMQLKQSINYKNK